MNTCKGMSLIYREKLYLFIYYLSLSYHRAEASIQANYSSFYNKFEVLNYLIKPLLHLICHRLLMSDIVSPRLLMSDIISPCLLKSDIVSPRLLIRSTVDHADHFLQRDL